MEDLSRLSDDELLAQTARTPEAFGVFYERHVRHVLAFAARGCRDTEQALDLTAEVFAADRRHVAMDDAISMFPRAVELRYADGRIVRVKPVP